MKFLVAHGYLKTRARLLARHLLAIGAFVALSTAAGCDALMSPSQYGTVTVAVSTRAGEPVGGVPLELYTGVRAMGYATTDASGHYTFERVPKGEYGVRLAAPDGFAAFETLVASPGSSVVDRLDVRPDSVVNVKFVLLKRGNGSLAVDVRDSTGTPIQGVAATLYDAAATRGNATTDAGGHAGFASVPFGVYGISIVRPAAFLDANETPTLFRDGLVVDAQSSQTITFTLARCNGSLLVTVKDQASQAAAGVPLRLYTAFAVTRDTVTGADGTVRFTSLACGEYGVTLLPNPSYTFVAGRGTSFVDGLAVHRGSALSATLAVRSCRATLNVVVRDASGTAVSGAVVTLYSARGVIIAQTTGASGTLTFAAAPCGQDLGVNVVAPAGYSVPSGRGSSYFDGITIPDGGVDARVFVLNHP